MKKIFFSIALILIVCSCEKTDENVNENVIDNEVTIKQLISSVEKGDDKYDDEIVTLKADFKFSIFLSECLGECSGSRSKEDFDVSDTYLFQDFYLCYNKDEIVLVDSEDNKIPIINFPEYQVSIENLDIYEIHDLVEDIEIEAKVFYNKTYNYCNETVHPGLYLELDTEKLNEIFESIENINPVE